MKATVHVAAVQMDLAWLEPEKNVRRMGELAIRASQEQATDLVVFPELANTGYVTQRSRDFGRKYAEQADTIPGYTTEELGRVAADRGLHIAVGVCQRHPTIPGTLYNAAVLIGPAGELIGVHHKVHIPGEEKHYFYPGNTVGVHRTDLGTIGLMVCYDLRFPELARLMALQGAEMLIAVYNGPRRPRDIARRFEFTAAMRAQENQCYVVACNRTGSDGEVQFAGCSAIAAPTGDVLAVAGEGEEVLRATFSRDLLLEERAFHTNFRDRRPDLYGPLCAPF